MIIRKVQPEDFESWYRLRVALWPDATGPEEQPLMQDYLSSETMTAFVAQTADGQIVGFLEANIRYYAEDCLTHNVGYIEGWYVEAEYRQQGVGGALVRAAEAWARSKGCREMASDCLLENEVSLEAHLALGYAETSRLIHFVKPLDNAKKSA
jgi:aminoglycoside 6'-N-acetyltransferase I